MPAVGVEEPNHARVGPEGPHGGQAGGIVVAPISAGAAEGGQAGRGRETGPTEGEYPAAGPKRLVEGLDVVVSSHGACLLSRDVWC